MPCGSLVTEVGGPAGTEYSVAVPFRCRDSSFRRRQQKKKNTANKRPITATPPTTPPATAPMGTDRTAGAGEAAGAATAPAPPEAADDGGVEADNIGVKADVEIELEVGIIVVTIDGDMLVVVDEAEAVVLAASKGSAIAGFVDRKPAVKAPVGHPALQGLDLQHPRNGGVVCAHVYQLLPSGHS